MTFAGYNEFFNSHLNALDALYQAVLSNGHGDALPFRHADSTNHKEQTMTILGQYRWTRAVLGIALALAIRPALAESPHSLSVGGRYHTENTVFTDLPYGNGDISYGLAYTFAEEHVGLKLGADFSPDVSGTRDAPHTNKTDYVISPQPH